MSGESRKVHSEEYFVEFRDFWWNADFLKLMGERLKLNRIRSVLDVGCGRGHWGQVLAPVLSPTAEVVGIDREAESLRLAGERARGLGLSERYRYAVGDAMRIPFADNTFEMVTCQTVLIYLADSKEGLREMLRVLKPGGLLLAVEPNNLANLAVMSNLTAGRSVDEILERLRFSLICERGKKALGLGFDSEGDLIPGYLAELGLEEVRVYQSDKTAPLFPPYASDEQRANAKQLFDWVEQECIGWSQEDARRYFVAGGGRPEEFDPYWKLMLSEAREITGAIEAGKYHSAGGHVFYLSAGRKRLA